MNSVAEDKMWDGFADAIVQVALARGPAVLVPRPVGRVGVFPFHRPVHILTAYNPAGRVIDAADNEARHDALASALAGNRVFPTVGSAADGTFREPGYGLLEGDLQEAIELARVFGQRAIYRWTPDVLSVIGVDEEVQIDLGWTLQDLG
ncbi:MAG: hypothetical protein ACI9C1_000810 [Candidatus Aldehydirespiratoraceae bacterium]|jgi:hypothetical protein